MLRCCANVNKRVLAVPSQSFPPRSIKLPREFCCTHRKTRLPLCRSCPASDNRSPGRRFHPVVHSNIRFSTEVSPLFDQCSTWWHCRKRRLWQPGNLQQLLSRARTARSMPVGMMRDLRPMLSGSPFSVSVSTTAWSVQPHGCHSKCASPSRSVTQNDLPCPAVPIARHGSSRDSCRCSVCRPQYHSDIPSPC